MQWVCEGRKRDEVRRGGRVGFLSLYDSSLYDPPKNVNCFSLLFFSVEKKRKHRKKGIYFHCDSTTHIWLPNHKSVIFFLLLLPYLSSCSISLPCRCEQQCFLLLGAWGTGAAALSVTGVNNSISAQPQSPRTHSGFSGTVLDSIAWEQSKSSQNSSFHAKCSPRWIPSVLCNSQANFQASRNKTNHSAYELVMVVYSKHSNVSVFHQAC